MIPYAAVICLGEGNKEDSCGTVKIDRAEYFRQMALPDSLWKCPECRSVAEFDDCYWEELHLRNEE